MTSFRSGAWCALALALACGRTTANGVVEEPAAAGVAPDSPEPSLPTTGGVTSAGSPSRLPSGGSGVSGGAPITMGGSSNGGDAPLPAAGAGGEPAPSAPDCDPIVFDDAPLEQLVRDAAGKPSGALTSADVTSVLDIFTPPPSSLRGMECLTALRTFEITGPSGGLDIDLSPLAGLPELFAIALDRTPLQTLAPLGTLPKLEQLYLFQLPGSLDLRPLATSLRLQLLYLDGDAIQDLEPLGSVPTLTYLSMSGTALGRPESIAKLTSLTDLNAPRVFTDVTPLAALTSLGRLRIGHGPITNFSALRTLTQLQYLDVSGTGIDSLEPVASMTRLINLTAGRNRLHDLAPLARLHELVILVLVDNLVLDTTPLADNPGLGQGDFVYLDRNPFSCADESTTITNLSARGVTVTSDCP
jgi:hypothetical protein